MTAHQTLSSALRLTPGEVVALVGGGGKTTAMFQLAAEVVAAGGRAITTTTTRIFAAQTRLAPVHVQSLSALWAALPTSPHVLLTGQVDEQTGKAFGVPPEDIVTLKSLIANSNVPVTILIEADGSRMRPFKAPADHEPGVPACATLVVPVVGIDCLGKPLTAQFVHRPERVAQIYLPEVGGDAGERIVTPHMVATVVSHPLAGRKCVPPGARFIPLINKVESEEQKRWAGEIAERLLAQPGVDGVVAGAAANRESPVTQVWLAG